MSRLTVLTNEILPLVVKKSCLEFVGCESNAKCEGDSQYSSNVMFLTVKVKRKQRVDNDESREVVLDLPVVVKFQIDDVIVREWLRQDALFHNEVLVYEKILPLLNNSSDKNIINDISPKFYYGNSTLGEEPEKDILVLEDMRQDGYRLTEERLFLDYDHIALAMKQLGRLHALSYAAKQKNKEEFLENVNRILECRYTEDNNEFWYYMFKYGIQRLFDRLASNDEYSNVVNSYCNKIKEPIKLLGGLLRPEEPVAVFVHGDYCRNNVFYKYNEQGKPVGMKFYDLAMSRYSSPAIDICFFLFLNASSDMRRRHWDEFLSLYHESLVSTVPGVIVPTLQDVHTEVRTKGLYPFLMCSFFLPQMAAGVDFIATEHAHKTVEERCKIVLFYGGDKEVQLLEALFVELVERKIIC